MSKLITFLTVGILYISNIHPWPIEITTDYMNTFELVTTETAVATTTTTLPPEIDREWEDLVLAGPLVVNYLNLFMVLVSRADDHLVTPPGYTIKHIQNIGSLREILYQISSSMQNTFQMAYDDLIRTQDGMEQIPDHVKAGLLLIKTAQGNLLSKLLPYTLRNANRAAKEGSSVSKPVLNKFIAVQSLLKELVKVVGHTKLVRSNTDYFTEANTYVNDIKTQWDILVKLFQKFSERAELTQATIHNNFIDPIDTAQKENTINTESQRTEHLENLVPSTIFIDQSAYLLSMMARTYSEISNDHVINQIADSTDNINLNTESARVSQQRLSWQNTVSQSVKVARLAQERHNQFVATGAGRQAEYATYLQSAIQAK